MPWVAAGVGWDRNFRVTSADRAPAEIEGGRMARICDCRNGIVVSLLSLAALPAMAQSFRGQCPTSTITPPAATNNVEPGYTAPTYSLPTATASDYTTGKTGQVNGAIKCQQVAGGDGYATMADGTQTYMFSFGPLSGLANIAQGLPGTTFPGVFDFPIPDPSVLIPGYPNGAAGVAGIPTAYNGAIGLVGNNVAYTSNMYQIQEGAGSGVMTFAAGANPAN